MAKIGSIIQEQRKKQEVYQEKRAAGYTKLGASRETYVSAPDPAQRLTDLMQARARTTPSSDPMDPQPWRSGNGSGFDLAKFLTGTGAKGANAIAKQGSSALSFLERNTVGAGLGLLTGDREIYKSLPFYQLNEGVSRDAEALGRAFDANTAAGGKAAQIAESIGVGTIAAIPQALVAMATAGGSMAAQGLEAASAAAQASPTLARTLQSAAGQMAKSPNYWTSFFSTVGNSYESAKADGADDTRAALYALADSLIGSVVEVSGGIQTLPGELRGGRFTVRKWIDTMLDEGKEEVVQGVLSRGLENTVYGKGNPIASLRDGNAMFNPGTMASEFGMGAAVGGILGGAQGLLGNVAAPRGETVSQEAALTGSEALAREAGQRAGTENRAQEAVEAPRGDFLTEQLFGREKAASQGETAKPVQAGRVTTIQAPYQGETPVQAQQNETPQTISLTVLDRARERIQSAQTEAGGRGIKTVLTRLYQQMFQPVKGVSVHDMTFKGAPYLVDINRNVPGKVISDPNLTAEKLALLDQLPIIVQNGDYVGSGQYKPHGSKSKPVIRYDYFETPVQIGETPYIARFDVEVLPGANNYRTHQIVNMDLTQAKARYPGPVPGPSSDASGPVEGTRPLNLDSTIPQGADVVKSGEGTDGLGAADAGFDPYTAAQMKYGTLPSGENPVRSDDAPASVSGFDRVSQSVATAKGAAVTPEDFVPLLESETMKGGFSFIPITNSDTVQAAIGSISEKGWESALADWTADVRAGKAGAGATATGALLYNNAVNSGEFRTALDIFTDYQVLVRNSAQGLQAARILKTMTPESRLYMMRRSVRNMADAMRLGDVQIDQALESEYLNAKDDAAADAAIEKIQQNIADQIPSTLLDKWTALRYVNMLGNFKTQVRNLSGNVAMRGIVGVKDAIAAGLERLTGTERTKSLKVSRPLLNAAKADFSTVQREASGEGKYTLSMEDPGAFTQGVMDKRRIFKTGALEAYRKATDWSMNNGYFGDAAFLRNGYARALAGYLKAQGVSVEQFGSSEWQSTHAELLDKARAYSIQEAQEATFRDSNTLSDWISRVGRRKNTPAPIRIASEGLMPFRKTPANVLLRAEEYSPLGILNTAWMAAERAASKTAAAQKRGLVGEFARAGQEVTGSDIANSMAKALTGTGVFLAGMLLSNAGFLRGKDDEDKKQAAFDDLTGHQAYSLELPDGSSVTLDWLSPAAMPLFMGAQLMNEIQDGGFALKDLESSLTSIADPMLQMSMLQGVNDTLDDLKYSEDNLGQMAVSLALNYLTQGLTNSLVGQLERAAETKRQSTYVDKDSPVPAWLQRELGRASAKTPGWDYRQIPFIDAWGRMEETGDTLARILNNTLNPAYVSQVDTDKVEKELQRIAQATGDTSVFPQRAGRYFTVDGERKDLTAQEYTRYAQSLGKGRYGLVKEAVGLPAYRAMSDEERAEYVGKLYAYADAEAKSAVSSYQPEEWVENAKNARRELGVSTAEYIALYQKYGGNLMSGSGYEKTREAVKAGLTVEEYAEYKVSVSGLTADKDANGTSISGSKKEKVIAAIDAQDLSATEKDWLYLLNYDGKNAQKDLRGMPWNR